MEHTSGPWEYCKDRDANGYRRIWSPGREYTIAIPQSHEADARLIAAAPELLEACKYAFQNLKPQGNVKKDFSGHNAMAALSRAIAKAEGDKL